MSSSVEESANAADVSSNVLFVAISRAAAVVSGGVCAELSLAVIVERGRAGVMAAVTAAAEVFSSADEVVVETDAVWGEVPV
eukprot:497748-Rhodomonas_salina.1